MLRNASISSACFVNLIFTQVFYQKGVLELQKRLIWLPNPEILIATIEKLLKAFENACPPLEGYSDGIDKGEVEGNKEVTITSCYSVDHTI